MNPRSVTGLGVVAGATAGVVLGVALLTSPAACADDFLPVPPFQEGAGDFPVFGPPGNQSALGSPEVVSETAYYSVTQDYHYTLPFMLPNEDEPVTGSYDTTYQNQIFGSYLTYDDATEKVTDSTGVAPAVGTTWEGTTLGIHIPTGDFENPDFGTVFYSNYTMTTPTDGFADDFVLTEFSYANQFYIGPQGIFDYLVDLNSGFPVAPVPIIDIPFTASPAAATDLVNAGDVADAGTLWSDLFGLL